MKNVWKFFGSVLVAILLIVVMLLQPWDAVARPVYPQNLSDQQEPGSLPLPVFSNADQPVLQQPSAVVSVSIPAGPFKVGDTIVVTINIDTGTLISRGAAMSISFNPAVLQCQYTGPSSPQPFGDIRAVDQFYFGWAIRNGASTAEFGNTCNNTAGLVGEPISQVLLGAAGSGPTGSGFFARISFIAIADGISDLSLTNVDILDVNINPMPYLLASGQIIVGNPQPTDATFTPTLTASATSPGGNQACVKADLNNDFKVDVFDVSIFGSYFGQTGVNCLVVPADFNCDGRVDVRDVGFLSECIGYSYLPQTPSTTPTQTNTATTSATLTVTSVPTVTPTRTITQTPTRTITPGGPTFTATSTSTQSLTPTQRPGDLIIKVEPSTSTVNINQQFTVAIKVDITKLSRGAQVQVTFDKTVLRFDGIEEGSFYRNWAETKGGQTLMLPPFIDPAVVNQSGLIPSTAVSVLGIACSEGATGVGDLFILEFTSLKAGQSSITLDAPTATGADPICSKIQELDAIGQNGVVTVLDQLEPTKTATPTRTPTRTATTSLAVTNTATLTQSVFMTSTPTRTPTYGSGGPTEAIATLASTLSGIAPTNTAVPTVSSNSSISVEPKSVEAAGPGETFTVDIVIDVDKLSRNAEFAIQFNPAVLEIEAIADEGKFYKDWARENGGSVQVFFESSPKFDNAVGEIKQVAIGVFGAVGPDPLNPLGVLGKGSVLKITFKTKAVGVSEITIQNATVTDNLGVQPQGAPEIPLHALQLKVNNGQVFVGVTPTPTSPGGGGGSGTANPTGTSSAGGATNTPRPAATVAAQGTQVSVQVLNAQGTPISVNAEGTAVIINELGTPEFVDNPLAANEGEQVNTLKVIGNVGEFIGIDGILTSDVELRSVDGMCVVLLNAGVQAITKDNYPLEAIEIQRLAEAPPANQGWALVGAPCQLGPEGAFFVPSIDLLMSYAGVSLPDGVAEKNLVVGYYDPEKEQWVPLDSQPDLNAGVVTAKVDHFSIFVIMAKSGGLSLGTWLLIITIVLIEVLLGIWLFLYLRRRRAAGTKADSLVPWSYDEVNAPGPFVVAALTPVVVADAIGPDSETSLEPDQELVQVELAEGSEKQFEQEIPASQQND